MPIMECLIKRPEGTTVTFPGVIYEFKPAAKGEPHLCNITNTEHAERLAAIPEGYRYAAGTPAAKVSAADVALHDATQRNATPEYNASPESQSTDNVDDKARRKAAAAIYKEKFGQNPPSRWSAERIEQELAE